MNRAAVTIFILIISLAHCSSLLVKKDYEPGNKAMENWDIRKALDEFPKGERGGFITTMEKTYLNLLSGKPEIDELANYSRKIDNQIRFKATRELKSFFYQETPEGYYASEHEIIWLHLLLSWGYSMRSEFDKAYIEAKICSNLLSNEWSEEGRFDDPLIRIILGSVWTMCGEWEEAQVDFRAAYKLDPSLKWAKAIGDLNKPPANLIVILGGSGPEPVWDPEFKSNPFRGFRGIKFNPRGVKSKLVIKDSGKFSSELNITPDSSYWYKRHFIRDNEIQDVIQDSQYATKAAGSGLKSTAITMAGVTAGILIATGGIALGGGVIVLGIYAESGEIIGLGALAALTGSVWGYNTAKRSYNYSKREFKEDMDASSAYRFVRFLPEYAWVGWSKEKLREPVTIYKNGKPLLSSNSLDISASVNIVSLGYYPDCSNTPDPLNARYSLGRAENPDIKNEAGNTKLHSAIEKNNFDYIKQIVEQGADVDLLNDRGESPLHTAVKFERIEIANFLLSKGAKPDIKDGDGITPLNTAVIFEQSGIVKLLIEKGADINSKTKQGWNSLQNAVYCNNIEITMLLLKNGALVNEKIDKGYKEFPAGSTALKIARINKNMKIIQMLKEHGAKE
jgi:ankyrin repeat protein